ncbi:DIS3-like exonuclease 1 [Holothuria leucospilota]|uniref:DIS3-like exonuclease 1 n=1 Tax=Holothuria leucospilota TaxID=206669 RepID=A0A9Q1H266_HOLLE|nr:DIS3-like exonuclease 1 [Holothuria leucospilota]
MLPSILSSDLCSLIGGVDRYAVSVIWKLRPDTYEVEKVWYGRTIISSSYKMYYEAAQMLHDGEEVSVEEIPELGKFDEIERQKKLADLKWSVNKLIEIASHLKAKREREGAVQLEGVEVKVELNEEQEIENLVPKQLRHHPLPRQEQFGDLVLSAKAKNFEIDTSSNKALAVSLDKCIDPDDPVYNKILRSLATKAMSNALYFSTGSLSEDQYFHYGLGLDLYTHFTSPIRRYADVIVHRLLMAATSNEGQLDEGLLPNSELQQLCVHINSRHRAAQNAQQDSQELFQALFFRDKDSETDECCCVDAVIQGIRANGLLIFVPRYGIKGAVYLQDKSGLVLSFDSSDQVEWIPGSIQRSDFSITVKTATGEWTYNLFEHITVKISVQTSRAHSETLRFNLAAKKRHKSELDDAQQGTGHSLRTDIIKLRHHPLPRQEQFGDLVLSAKAKNFEIDTSSNKALAESLDKCIDPDDPVYNKILRSLATKAMSNALYFSTGSLSEDQYFHYGLGLDLYTHFTSPIRRYADVIVHRLLMAATSDEGQLDEGLLPNSELQQLCVYINSRHRGLRANGLLIFVPRYGIKGAVYLQDKSGLVLSFDSSDQVEWIPGSIHRSDFSITVKAATGEWTYNLFEHITVKISVQTSRAHSETLRFNLAAKKRHKSELDDAQQGTGHSLRTDIIKEVMTADKSMSTSEMREKVNVMGTDITQLHQLYHQTKEEDSLYDFLETMQELSLQDDS